MQYIPTHIELLEAVTTVASVAGTSGMQLDFVLTRGSSPSNTFESPLSRQSLITSSFTGNAEANTSGCLLILARASLLKPLLHHRFVTVVKLHAQYVTVSLFTPTLNHVATRTQL